MLTKGFLEEVYLLLASYELDIPTTLEELIKKVEWFHSTPIKVVPTSLPYCVSGFVVLTSSGSYNIFLDNNRSPNEQTLILTHELAHIMRGDVQKVTLLEPTEVIQALQQGQSSNHLDAVTCRRFDEFDENERKIEYIALQIRRRLMIPEQNKLGKILQHWY